MAVSLQKGQKISLSKEAGGGDAYASKTGSRLGRGARTTREKKRRGSWGSDSVVSSGGDSIRLDARA